MGAIRVTIQDLYTGEAVEYLVDDFVFAGSNRYGELHTAKTDDIHERHLLVDKINEELQMDM